MKRIAIVVQRCHESVVGGAEALAWQYARLLSSAYDVEVLTSTATEHVRWDNVLAAGAEMREGIAVRRFPVVLGRTPYWDALYQRMADEAAALRAGTSRWREALQDEFIRMQGPYCPDLSAWLRGHDYAAVLFCTYLYPTTYFGIRAVAPERAILVPTLHDETPALFGAFRELYARCPNRIWLTDAERKTAQAVWGQSDGEVIGMAVEQLSSESPEIRDKPYVLYCGRIEAGKGCDDLLRAFERLPQKGEVRLVFTGTDVIGLPNSPDIEFLGFVDDARKRALMAGALAFVLPSRHESFSIVTLEAMAQRTPVLVNGDCEVMRDHIAHSGAGLDYHGVDDLVAKLQQLCSLPAAERERMGNAGREYVLARYDEGRVRERLVDYMERVIARAEG